MLVHVEVPTSVLVPSNGMLLFSRAGARTRAVRSADRPSICRTSSRPPVGAVSVWMQYPISPGIPPTGFSSTKELNMYSVDLLTLWLVNKTETLS